MSNIKRVSLVSSESNNDKTRLKRKNSLRISVPIEEPTNTTYSRFNYETLYKSALNRKRLKREKDLKEVQNGSATGLINGGLDDDDDEAMVLQLAKKFEQKYGGTLKKDKYSDLAAGYDESDSFIDDTDAYNDEMSEDLVPKHGGYYLNQGKLELERIEVPEEVMENEEEISMRKIKRTINVIQSSDEESSEAEESGRDENDDDDEDDTDESLDEEEDEEESGSESEISGVDDVDKKEGEDDEMKIIKKKKLDKEEKENIIIKNINNNNNTDNNKVPISNVKSTDPNKVNNVAKPDISKPPINDVKASSFGSSINSIIESVVENRCSHSNKKNKLEKDNNVVKKKRKREKENEEDDTEQHHKHKHKHKKQMMHKTEEKEKNKEVNGIKEVIKEHKHAKKHKDKNSEEKKQKENNNEEKKEKKKSITVKELLNEMKEEEPTDNATLVSVPAIAASIPTSEDVEILEELNPAENSLVNGHNGKDELVADLKLPNNLPEDVCDIVNRLKNISNQVGISNLTGRKNFPQDVNNLLISLDAKCRSLSSSTRSAVFGHLGTFLPLSKDTLIKRARKMSVDKEEESLEKIVVKLKDMVDSVMPRILLQYNKDCKVATDLAAQKNAEGVSEDQKPEKPILPKKTFPWNDEMRSFVRDIVDIRIKCFRIMNIRKDTEDDYVKEYLNIKVKTIWPDGWMRTSTLLKESRAISKKYVPKPASKKVVITPLLPHVAPTPVQQQQSKQQKQSQQQKQPKSQSSVSVQSSSLPDSTGIAVSSNPNSYQTTESLTSTAPSLFSQIHSSMSKVPLFNSTSASISITSSGPTISTTSSLMSMTNMISGSGSITTINKKSSPTPKSSAPHSISNIINTTKAHQNVSSTRYSNYPTQTVSISTGGISSNTFSKSQSDLPSSSTSLSTISSPAFSVLPAISSSASYPLLSTAQALHVSSLNYSMPSVLSSSPTAKTSSSCQSSLSYTSKASIVPTSYKVPFSQPLPYSTSLSSYNTSSTSYPVISSSPSTFLPPSSPSSSPTLSCKSISPSPHNTPKKRITPSPPSSNVLDLSPKSGQSPVSGVSYGKDVLTSPVSSKSSGGGSMLSLKQRILQDTAKTSTHSEEVSSKSLPQSSIHSSRDTSDQKFHNESITAASALSQMISESLLTSSQNTLSSSNVYSRPESVQKSTVPRFHSTSSINLPASTSITKSLGPLSKVEQKQESHLKYVQSTEARERKTSRSSGSRESDGGDEIVADVLKSLITLNQMSESPEKNKIHHDNGRNYTPESNKMTPTNTMDSSNTTPTSSLNQAIPKMATPMGFEDEFLRHIKMKPQPTSTPNYNLKDMKLKTFQNDQILLNNTAPEFSMNLAQMNSTSTPPQPHVTQGNCLMEGLTSHSVIMPPCQSTNRSTPCTTFKPRCHYSDS